MPRIVKIVLVALVVGAALAGALAYLGKSNFDRSEYGR
jgi:hypothetical protein